MRKYIFIFCSLLFVLEVTAQDLLKPDTLKSSKNSNKQYLPEAGDFAIGINAVPILNFIGNAFNGYGTNGTKNTIDAMGGEVLNLNYAPKPDLSIMAKYFKTDRIAYRMNLGVKLNTDFEREYVISDVLAITDPFSDHKLIDQKTSLNVGGSFSGGLEYRVGKNRIQGIFSGDLLFAYQTKTDSYTYANAITIVNSKPTMSAIMPAFDAAGYRTLEKKYGDVFYAGAMISAGVEYFIMPKVALGSEVNLMCYYSLASSSYLLREGLNPYTNEIERRNILLTPGNRSLQLGSGNYGSKLYLIFYF